MNVPFSLSLHPEKTRLIEFGRYAEARRMKRGEGLPETFDFLGFTHISGKTRRGDFTVHRKTARKKFQAKLKDLQAKLRRCRHAALPQVGTWLQSVLRGWYRYYAVGGGDSPSLTRRASRRGQSAKRLAVAIPPR